jgi:formylglycine-generating enzyme required for sulfatase activity/energy-coupling factor transporter ATP-binding protein EcfA2
VAEELSADQELNRLEQAIAGQEATLNWLPAEQRAAAEGILASLQARRQELLALNRGSGAVAQGDGSTAVGERGINVGQSVGGDAVSGTKVVVNVESGATFVIGNDAPEPMSDVDRHSALGRYLQHLIAHNRYLQLQGIRSGGRLVHIELEQIYVTLRATRQRTVQAEERWLAHEATLAPGEKRLKQHLRETGSSTITETVTVTVNEALAAHRRLVVLGDPGSGKTTLLRYLALVYGRDLAQGGGWVQEKLGIAETGFLPILLPLRQIGSFLESRPDEGVEGHKRLLEFLQRYLQNERIDVPLDFFDDYLRHGRALLLFDGMDEVAGNALRRRVARLVEAFTRAYPDCRYVVTSRIVGYSGVARLGEGYVTSTVRDFTLADVTKFLNHWHRLVAVGQMGAGQAAEHYAQEQTRQLLEAVQSNERIRELAINPLLLTVIALVHRDRVRLPDRRAELYAEAVDVLMGKWDEARGVVEQAVLADRPFDAGDRRLMLQSVALHMQERTIKEIETADLHDLLETLFLEITNDKREATAAAGRFLAVIAERTGLLAARGAGVYAFSHLTFQEYLAALAVAAREDYVAYSLARSADTWWREVILLEAGYLSTQSKERVTRLIQTIADHKTEPEPYHNLVLAAECLRDAGESRVQGNLATTISQRLRQGLEAPPPFLDRWFRSRMTPAGWIERRSAVVAALVHIGTGYWTQPYGEPEWIRIPAGKFTMGSETGKDNQKPCHPVYLDEYWIARVPMTNAQYFLFVQATGHAVPDHWQDGRPPKHLESHPVTKVSWHDAVAYCRWLSQVTGKSITLPSEAEWEKAARGDKDAREFPWGETFDRFRCNTYELGVGTTTPVGIFPDGASPYGVLDMSGNVWEWTRSWSENYPYRPDDGRESMDSGGNWRVLRGGSWDLNSNSARAAYRDDGPPDYRPYYIGFRVVVRRPPSHLDL